MLKGFGVYRAPGPFLRDQGFVVFVFAVFVRVQQRCHGVLVERVLERVFVS